MNLKSAAAALVIIAVVCLGVVAATTTVSAEGKGEALFKANCSVCHPNGSNVVNPKKTLHKKDRDVNNVKTADDIVNRMRHPGPGMTQFDEKMISNKDAHEIAEYILKTFK